MFGDNESVVNSSILPHAKLHKRHNALSFHRVREAIASGVYVFAHISGENNPADILSKHWGYSSVWHMLKALMFVTGDTVHSPGKLDRGGEGDNSTDNHAPDRSCESGSVSVHTRKKKVKKSNVSTDGVHPDNRSHRVTKSAKLTWRDPSESQSTRHDLLDPRDQDLNLFSHAAQPIKSTENIPHDRDARSTYPIRLNTCSILETIGEDLERRGMNLR
jgi:hypothetical protein